MRVRSMGPTSSNKPNNSQKINQAASEVDQNVPRDRRPPGLKKVEMPDFKVCAMMEFTSDAHAQPIVVVGEWWLSVNEKSSDLSGCEPCAGSHSRRRRIGIPFPGAR